MWRAQHDWHDARTGTLRSNLGDAETELDKIRAALKTAITPDRSSASWDRAVELCLNLRCSSIQTPLIVLSENGEEVNKILLLEAGVDGYIVKPFSVRELLARIRALLRRTVFNRGRTIASVMWRSP